MKALLPLAVLVPFSAALASACYRTPENSPPRDTPSLPGRLQKLNADLKVGDVGPNVRTVHDYLAAYGYYPNADLAVRFPAWRPLIANEPQDPNVFDQQTAGAVRQLQVNYGLSPTGIVDGSTRAAMVAPRCGVPDGIARLDSSDKFSVAIFVPLQSPVSTHVAGSPLPGNVTLTQLIGTTSLASATWGGATNLQFNVFSGTGSGGATGSSGGATGRDAGPGGAGGTALAVTVQFGAIDGPGNQLGETFLTGPFNGAPNTQLITLDIAENWSMSAQTPSNAVDLQSVVLHELGHAMGLSHSGFPGAVMYPVLGAGAQNRALALDDRLGVRPIYDKYVQVPETANDIGAGADGSVWKIGTTPAPPNTADHNISKWNGSSWDVDTSGYAVRISVAPDGTPWVVNALGNVFHKSSSSPSSGTWQYFPGLSASDIGVSAGGVWALSTTAVAGGFQIYSLQGQQWILEPNIGAVRIAVDSNGIPWAVQASGAVIWRYEGWGTVPGISNALDIALPPGPLLAYAWAVNNVSAGQQGLTLWDMQSSVSGSAPFFAPSVAQWWQAPFNSSAGAATAVASAGPNGRPWIVDGAGRIFAALVP